MSDPFSPLKVIHKSVRVGEERQVPARILEALRGTDAYDSYERLYLIEGRKWRVRGQVTQADGQRFYLLVCVHE